MNSYTTEALLLVLVQKKIEHTIYETCELSHTRTVQCQNLDKSHSLHNDEASRKETPFGLPDDNILIEAISMKDCEEGINNNAYYSAIWHTIRICTVFGYIYVENISLQGRPANLVSDSRKSDNPHPLSRLLGWPNIVAVRNR